jgi:putative heme iron utilization protein
MTAPSPAERARTLLAGESEAVLATLDADYTPLLGPVPFVADADGHPVMVLSRLSRHTARAWLDPRAGLLVGDRLSLQGQLVTMPGMQQLAVQDRYLEAHPDTRTAVESLDFAWFRLDVMAASWTDDDGVVGWVTARDLADASPDPVAPHAPVLIAHLRDRLAEDLVELARTHGGQLHARSAAIVELDRYGLVLRAENPAGPHTVRIPFPERLDDPREVHSRVGYMMRSIPISG